MGDLSAGTSAPPPVQGPERKEPLLMTDKPAKIVAQALLRTRMTLGEGPIWDARNACLWCVDIKQKRLFRYAPQIEQLDQWESPAQIGWVLPESNGGLAAGLQGGIYHFAPESGKFSLIQAVETDTPGNRQNDATSDAEGGIWFGTMDDGEAKPSGRFYRYAEGKIAASGLPGVPVTNGPALSPCGRILYHVDTLGKIVYGSRLDDNHRPYATRPFIEIEAGAGYPDGPVVDSAGCIWIALYGGWAARRYSPEGALLETVRFPVANVTKLAFGGADLRTVYATTSSKGLDSAALAAQPEAGFLFRFRADVAGLPISMVKL